MKRLDKPVINPIEIFDACGSGIADSALTQRLQDARDAMINNYENYERRADVHQLFLFQASAWGNDAQQVISDITKGEFTSLYSNQMVGSGRPGRKYYDQLIMLAPLGKCPLCGFGHATTLDHFLSKSRYPAFSVLCTNLVPACSDCNSSKGASVITEATQILHPYFEGNIIETESWLFAEVIESKPATVRYFVKPPNNWPTDLSQRIANYFNDLSLARRFAVEAASELAGLTQILDMLDTHDVRHAHLSRISQIERRHRKNLWKAALYEALASSEWFQDGGYRNPVQLNATASNACHF